MSIGLRTNYTDQFLETAKPVLEALIFQEYELNPSIISKLYRVMGSDRWGEQTVTQTGLRPAVEKSEGGNFAEDAPLQGYDKTYQHLEYGLVTAFSETLIEDDQMGMVEDGYRSLGHSSFQTREILAASVFNNGFTDTGPDGVSLFNTAHPLVGGGTYGNRPSTDIAISVAGFREAMVDMMRQVDDRGINLYIMPRKVFVSPEGSFAAQELTGSQYKPFTANNEMNTFNGQNLEVISSPYLVSTTAWFMLAETNKTQLRWYDRVAPETKTWVDDNTGTVKTRIRFRCSNGYSDYKGTWGSLGTGAGI
jgi:phage major head subunit gpT-like protein